MLHELAHHVALHNHGRSIQSHGREFKREFVRVFEAFAVLSQCDLVAAAVVAKVEMKNEIPKFSPGELVLCGGRTFRIEKKRRTRYEMTCLETDKVYTAMPGNLELVRPINPASAEPKTGEDKKKAKKAAPKKAKKAEPAEQAATDNYGIGDRVRFTPDGKIWTVVRWAGKVSVRVTDGTGYETTSRRALFVRAD